MDKNKVVWNLGKIGLLVFFLVVVYVVLRFVAGVF